jgi:maltooligosyltrehalose synthase
VIAGRLFARLIGEATYSGALWKDARLDLREAPERLTNVLTGETVSSASGLGLGEVLADLPAAVLLGPA